MNFQGQVHEPYDELHEHFYFMKSSWKNLECKFPELSHLNELSWIFYEHSSWTIIHESSSTNFMDSWWTLKNRLMDLWGTSWTFWFHEKLLKNSWIKIFLKFHDLMNCYELLILHVHDESMEINFGKKNQ